MTDLSIKTIPTRALARRLSEMEEAKAEFEQHLERLLDGAPTVDLVRALGRDAEAAFTRYVESVVLVQEAR